MQSVLAAPRRRKPVTKTTVLIAAVFLSTYAVLGSGLLPMAVTNDFACFYMGGALFREGHRADVYDYRLQFRWWAEIVPGNRPIIPYVRPPFYLLPQSLMALFPLQQSLKVATGVSVLLFFACLWWMARRFGEDGLILGSLSLPTALAIVSGQDSVVLMSAMVLSYWLYERGWFAFSGAAIGLGLFKFHLLILIGPVLVWTRRWRLLAGFACAAAVEIALSFLLVGVTGSRAYVDLLLHRNVAPADEPFFATWTSSWTLMPNMKGLLLNLHLANGWTVGAGIALVILLSAIATRKTPWWLGFTAAMLGSILVVPHVFGYDFAAILPCLILCVTCSTSNITRALATWLCTPLPYAGNIAGAPWPALLPLSTLLLLASLAHEALTSARRQDYIAQGLI